VVKELSLRVYGHVELARLLRKPREQNSRLSKPRKGKNQALRADSEVEPGMGSQGDESTSDLGDEGAAVINVAEIESHGRVACEPWADDDVMSVTSSTSLDSEFAHLSPRKPNYEVHTKLRVVIEDSDWDDAEVLD
jgi:hypothetical protein